MKKLALFLAFFTAILFFVPNQTFAQTRYAQCDSCGYCLGKQEPGGWEVCRDCLYPSLKDYVAIDNKTLEINTNPSDPGVNQPIPPKKGVYYTQLGCVDSSLSSFADPSAAGGVLNFILSKLIFPIAGVLAFVFLIYGSFLLATAQDDRIQIEKGKKVLAGALVGLLFTFGSVLLVNIIGGDILKIPGFERGTPVTVTYLASCSNQSCPKIKAYVTTPQVFLPQPELNEGGGVTKIISDEPYPFGIKSKTGLITLEGVKINFNTFYDLAQNLSNNMPGVNASTKTFYIPRGSNNGNSDLLLEFSEDIYSPTSDTNIYFKKITVGDKDCPIGLNFHMWRNSSWEKLDPNATKPILSSVGYVKCPI